MAPAKQRHRQLCGTRSSEVLPLDLPIPERPLPVVPPLPPVPVLPPLGLAVVPLFAGLAPVASDLVPLTPPAPALPPDVIWAKAAVANPAASAQLSAVISRGFFIDASKASGDQRRQNAQGAPHWRALQPNVNRKMNQRPEPR